MGDYKIERLEPERFERLIPLMCNCFGIEVDIDYFKWKFLQNPAGRFIGFVAISNSGEYAAYYGVIPELYQIGNEKRIIYQSCDTMTHSSHRRKGLFQKLASACYQHLQSQNALFVIGFSGEHSTPGFLKFGWRHIFDMTYLFRPFPLSLISYLKHLIIPQETHRIEDLADCNEIIDLIKEPKVKNSQVMYKEFMDWRLSNPLIKYSKKVIVETSSGKPEGYFVYYLMKNKIILFDYLVNSAGALVKMISFFDSYVIKERFLGIVSFAQPETPFSDELRSNGFWVNSTRIGPLGKRVPFIIYAIENEMEQFKSPAQWEITPLCHDAL